MISQNIEKRKKEIHHQISRKKYIRRVYNYFTQLRGLKIEERRFSSFFAPIHRSLDCLSQSIIFVIHGELTIRLFEADVCARSVYLTRFKHETLETRLLIGSAYQRPFLLTLSFLLSSLRSNGELELSFLTD